MKTQSFVLARYHLFSTTCAVAVALHFGLLAGSAQTGDYFYTGSKETITLGPGTCDITAYGAQGGSYALYGTSLISEGGLGPKWKPNLLSQRRQR